MTMPTRTLAALLAVAATITAACLSILSGMQRGGLPAERVLWIAVGVVLVIAAHLLPALCRSLSWGARTAGGLIWLGCVAATCYGHAVFFVTSARHAGELRAAAVPVEVQYGRDLTVIARDRAEAVTRLARANARQCAEPCPSLIAERTSLAAKLDALNVEQSEAIRFREQRDRADVARDAAQADPITGPLIAFGWTPARTDLLIGLAFAAVLEAVACFAWLLALRPLDKPKTTEAPTHQGSHGVTERTVTPVTRPGHGFNPPPDYPKPMPPLGPPPRPADVDLSRIVAAIAANELRPTVIEIRKFLGCSQTRAVEVRRTVLAAESIKETNHANLDA